MYSSFNIPDLDWLPDVSDLLGGGGFGFDFGMVAGSVTALFLVALGLLLTYAGLSVFKSLQFIVCAAMGLTVGLCIQMAVGTDWAYLVAGVLALLAGWFGMRHYKVALYLAASLCSQLAVFLYFLKRAIEMLRGTLETAPSADTMMHLWWENVLAGGDVAAATQEVVGMQTAQIVGNVQDALQLLQRGMVIATGVGLVVGVLALLFGDYVIIVFTAVFGAAVLISMADTMVSMPQQAYDFAAIFLAATGIAVQCLSKWRGGRRRHRR